MIVAIILGVLALFDAMLAGYRAAAGRDGRIDKRGYFEAAIRRATGFAVALVAGHAVLVWLLVESSPDPAATWAAFHDAGTLCVWVFGGFATLTCAAMAFWLSPIQETRLIATVTILGPLTLVRPLVIAGGLAVAAARTAEPRVWLVAALAGTTMLALERCLGRRYAARY